MPEYLAEYKTGPVAFGDVLCIRTSGLAAEAIRFGSALLDKDNLDNHIAIVHHKDKSGTTWCIEGRPGGVGWRDAAEYFASPYTISNIGQPKTLGQRGLVCQAALAMLGTQYDWSAIYEDALMDLHLDDVWAEKWNGAVPGHVVCSSLAAYAYGHANLAGPTTEDPRHVQPADWLDFILANGYENAPGGVS